MIDNIELNNELERFYGEKKMNEDILLSEREKFIKALKNGIGEELKKELNTSSNINTSKVLNNSLNYTWWTKIKIKIKNWWNRIIN